MILFVWDEQLLHTLLNGTINTVIDLLIYMVLLMWEILSSPTLNWKSRGDFSISTLLLLLLNILHLLSVVFWLQDAVSLKLSGDKLTPKLVYFVLEKEASVTASRVLKIEIIYNYQYIQYKIQLVVLQKLLI